MWWCLPTLGFLEATIPHGSEDPRCPLGGGQARPCFVTSTRKGSVHSETQHAKTSPKLKISKNKNASIVRSIYLLRVFWRQLRRCCDIRIVGSFQGLARCGVGCYYRWYTGMRLGPFVLTLPTVSADFVFTGHYSVRCASSGGHAIARLGKHVKVFESVTTSDVRKSRPFVVVSRTYVRDPCCGRPC